MPAPIARSGQVKKYLTGLLGSLVAHKSNARPVIPPKQRGYALMASMKAAA
jgi:hypothetical protein